MSYADLEGWSRSVALQFISGGLERERPIAILAQRGPELVASMLGALRFGAVFVVLDSSYPEARLNSLIQISSPQALVVAGDVNLSQVAQRLASANALPIVKVALDDELVASGSMEFLDQATPDTPAYFLFTSGSTGDPKCICCDHRPLSHFIAWHTETFAFSDKDRFTMLSGLSHDPLLRDIFTPLSIGAALLIPSQDMITEPGALRAWLRSAEATVVHLTPALGQIILAGGLKDAGLPALKYLFWGGDQLAPRLITEFRKLASAVRHTNFYGSTETPQAVSYFECEAESDQERVPIGRGIHGFKIQIVDAQRKPVDVNVVGEIAVELDFLSLGYVRDGHLTPASERGIDAKGFATIYYTGDKGVCLPNGDVVMLGRSDDQIKVRGYRVDLSEVSFALSACSGVESAIALAIGRDAGLRIEAFVAVKNKTSETERQINDQLAKRLPAYMLPRKIWVFERSLSLLPNGKIDRAALQALAEDASGRVDDQQQANRDRGQATEAEQLLLDSWRAIFPSEVLSKKTSFLALGGDSLSYVNAYLAAEEVLGLVPEEWPNLTIEQLAASRVKRHSFWTIIDTPMLIRAVAITLVVAYHFDLTSMGDGFTGALFIVSGFMFGAIQFASVFKQQAAGSILRSFINIAIPTSLFTVASIAIDLILKIKVPILTFLFGSDLFLYTNIQQEDVLRHDGLIWYLHVLLEILLLLYVALPRLAAQFKSTDRVFQVAGLLFLVGCLGRFVVPAFLVPGFYWNGPLNSSSFQFSLTANFSTFLLGVLISSCRTSLQRSITFAAIVLFGLLTALTFGPVKGFAIAAAGTMIMVQSRMTVPRMLASWAFLLSGASLYIYLTHVYFGFLIHVLIKEAGPFMQTACALAGGIAVYLTWNYTNRYLRRKMSSHAAISSESYF